MFALNLRVVTIDGESEVPIKPKTIVQFEREFQTGLGRAFASDQKFEHMCWLAWKGSESSKTFDAWLETLVELEMAETAERPLSGTP